MHGQEVSRSLSYWNPMKQDRTGGAVKAACTTLTIVEEVSAAGIIGVTALADRLGIPKSTAFNYLSTLENSGYLVKSEGQYRLSARFLRFASQLDGTFDIVEVATPEVERLAEQTGEIVVTVVEEHGRAIVVHVARGADAINFDVHPGLDYPLHATAAGKAILAYLPDEQVDVVLADHGLESVTSETTTDELGLFDELDTIRKDGVAYNEEESFPGLNGVAVAIKDETGTVVGAVGIVGPSSRMRGDRLHEELPELLLNSANVIEVNMRYA